VARGHEVTGLPVGSVTDLIALVSPNSDSIGASPSVCIVHNTVKSARTLGIAAWPLNRLRTRLSIPLGLRHEGSTPSHCQHDDSPSRSSLYLTFEAVRLVAVEALGVCIDSVSCEFSLHSFREGSVRFLTIATCFLAATIFSCVSSWVGSGFTRYALCLLLGLVVVTISTFERRIRAAEVRLAR
jgi:hypothetical protein